MLKWKGHANGKDNEITGKVTIPNLSEEHDDMKDVDVDIEGTQLHDDIHNFDSH